MASDIQQVSREHSSGEKVTHITREHEKVDAKDNIEPYVADLEGEGYEAEKQRLVEKAEAVELTPNEAFTWNVDGDQSPCTQPSTLTPQRSGH
jgi:hypothetical protein